MNYNVTKNFTALDLKVGDLMYDAQEDEMVKVVFVGQATIKKVATLNRMGSNSYLTQDTETFRQIVLEETEEKMISVIDVFGKKGELPKLNNGKPRFRHLISMYTNTATNG